MERLVDYFAVVGYDFEREDKDSALRGKVLTRIPDNDIEGVPFTQGIELFCQPGGWYKFPEQKPPTFFVSVLTDAEGHRSYCCVHSFSEPIRSTSLQNHQRKRTESITTIHKNDGSKSGSTSPSGEKNPPGSENGHPEDYIDEEMCRVDNGEAGEDGDVEKKSEKQLFVYTSKCLVLISRIHDFRVLKNCLGLIYTVYIEDLSQSIENVIAKLLLIRVPPHGSKMLRFSIGAADKQVLQVPQSDNLPVTRSSVTMLLRQLGILNVLNILCAALVDQKLLFYSCSYTRLTEACNALTALMYPFVYSYPYIPILPKHLLECTSSPTPFLIGVHSSFKSGLTDLLDVVTVDLDGGVISIPECVNLPLIPEPYYTNLVETLTKVLCPDLVVADYAYPPDQVKTSEPERLDKEIRAIFLRLFCQLLMGYRSCLQVCRIHPDPIIRFKKEQYLRMRGFDLNDSTTSSKFASKLLCSQAFSLFIQHMGPPYRKLQKFDEVVSEMPDRLQGDIQNISQGLKLIKLIASDLYVNENPNLHPITEKIPKPSELSHNRTQQPVFPKLCPTAAQTFMEEKRGNSERQRTPKRHSEAKKRVPEGKRPSFNAQRSTLASSSRRLEVLRNLLSFIFESKTLEIKKIFQAVLRALKSRVARQALVEELVEYSKSHPQLDNQQFDYIARLINSALQDSSGQHDEYILPADMLPVVTTFYRKLCPTVMQFMYTVVQEHPVWTSSLFWENAFFDDIQDAIRKLYAKSTGKDRKVKMRNQTSPTHSSESNARRDNHLCMDIAAVELEAWEKKSPEQQKQDSEAEEGIVFSQAMHNAQRMVFMLVPLDSTRINRSKFLTIRAGEDSGSNSYVTSSIAGSLNESFDEEFDELSGESGDVSAIVSKFVSKFVDRVCTEAYISPDHTKALLNNVSALVIMQVESLRDVCMESKRLPPITKPKLLLPTLLIGEEQSFNGPIRGYLTPDGRGVAIGGQIGGPVLLPAEGALFVTNYRAIFIGTPCDPLASEQLVIRSFPVSTLFKSKTFNVHDFPSITEIDSSLQHGVQLRSSTFQLLLFSFDEDVSSDEQERLIDLLHTLRYPNNIQGAFASVVPASKVQMRHKTISPTLSNTSTLSTSGSSGAKALAKQMKRKVGLNKSNRISRLILTDAKSRTLYYPAGSKGPISSVSQSNASTTTMPRLPAIDEAMVKTLTNKDTMNRLILRSSENDYKRIGLITPDHHKYRLSRVNRMFTVCRTYPTCSILPMNMTDDQIKSIAHCHHNSRFPAIVWMHPTTKTLLLRAGGIRSRIASSLFKHGQKAPMPADEGTIGSSSEEERFLRNIAELTTYHKSSGLFRPKSTTSLNSVSSDSGKNKSNRGTKLTSSVRPMAKNKKWGTLTRSNGKSATDQLQQTNIKVAEKPPHQPSMQNGNTLAQFAMIRSFSQQAQFYILGDKGQLKNVKHEQQGKVLFVPIELPEPKQIRTSFKTLLKACVPADPPPVTNSNQQSSQSHQLNDSSHGFLKGVEESGWLEQVSVYLQASGAIVDIMDIHGASVMLSLYDGSDVVPLASSLSQLLLDPHYRTIEGFEVLIQKEWLSFGHRFAHRNRFNDAQSSGFTPVFLMFLDAVYQILRQMPMSFEFNSKLLEVIAYHSMSNRFNTFLLDSDYERLEAGILFDKQQPLIKMRSQTSPTLSPKSSGKNCKCLWEYIHNVNKSSTVFLNTFYSPNNLTSKILRPVSGVCRMKVWPYYLKEALGEGPCYDGLLGEMTAGTNHSEQVSTEASEALMGGTTGRRTVNACYDNVNEAQPDSIKMLLNEIERLKSELGVRSSSWEDTWKDKNKMDEEEITVPQITIQACQEANTIHKTLTVDLIHKNLEDLYQHQQPQIFVPQRFRTMTNVISSIARPGLRSSATNREDTSSEASYMVDNNSDAFTVRPLSDLRDKVSLYDQFQTSKIEVRTYEGSLWKQGAYMKGWKLRFFVLDTTKHELRQYENRGDITCKTIIDLKDLESVQLINPLSNAPKGTEDKSFFEVKVAKRLYHFIAESEAAAQDWVDNLQVTLQ